MKLEQSMRGRNWPKKPDFFPVIVGTDAVNFSGD